MQNPALTGSQSRILQLFIENLHARGTDLGWDRPEAPRSSPERFNTQNCLLPLPWSLERSAPRHIYKLSILRQWPTLVLRTRNKLIDLVSLWWRKSLLGGTKHVVDTTLCFPCPSWGHGCTWNRKCCWWFCLWELLCSSHGWLHFSRAQKHLCSHSVQHASLGCSEICSSQVAGTISPIICPVTLTSPKSAHGIECQRVAQTRCHWGPREEGQGEWSDHQIKEQDNHKQT